MIIKKINLLTLFSIATVASIYYFNNANNITLHDSSYIVDQSNQNMSPISRKVAPSKEILGFDSQYGNLPSTLRGTSLTNHLLVDEDGHLMITDDVKYVFDFFLSTITEESLDTIGLRVNEYLDHYLEEPALSEAKGIFENYIALKRSLIDLQEDMSEEMTLLPKGNIKNGEYLEFLRYQLDRNKALRAEHLNSEVHAVFYGQEETYDDYTYNRLLIKTDKSISNEEKQQRIIELQQTLPVDIQQNMRQSQISDELKIKEQQLIADGGTQEDVHQLRVDMFGEEAAVRLAATDKRNSAWQARVDSYLNKREQILAGGGLAEAELQLQVNRLRASLFDEKEQRRIITTIEGYTEIN